MTVEKIRYFIEVARTGSLTQAARNLYVSQPNLSKQMAQLEAECGFSLFRRTARSLELTAAGKVLFEHIQDVPQVVADAVDKARMCSRRSENSLSIGVVEVQESRRRLMPAVLAFAGEYPDVDIQLERNSFGKLRAGLHNGIYDVIITMHFDLEKTPEFEEMFLSESAPVIAVRKDAPLAKREFVSFGELRDENFVLICSSETPNGEERFLGECAAFDFTPRIVRRPRSLESLLLCVEAGMGIALLDGNVAMDAASQVCLVPISDIPSVAFSAAWRRTEERKQVHQFLAMLKAQKTRP